MLLTRKYSPKDEDERGGSCTLPKIIAVCRSEKKGTRKESMAEATAKQLRAVAASEIKEAQAVAREIRSEFATFLPQLDKLLEKAARESLDRLLSRFDNEENQLRPRFQKVLGIS